MSFTCYKVHGLNVLECAADGKRIGSENDAVELIGEAMRQGAGMVLIPGDRLEPEFFQLRTRIAGAIVQKFVTYQLRLVIIGDISPYVADSFSLRDFVYEANRGDQVWFMANRQEFEARMAATAGA